VSALVAKTARVAPGFDEAFRLWTRRLRAQVDADKIAAAMKGGPNAVLASLGWPEKGDERAHDAAAEFMRGLVAAHHATMRSSGKRALEGAVRKAVKRPDLSVPVDEKALSWARRRAGARMVDVTSTQVKSVRTIIERKLEQGAHPNEIADTIRRVVGLTDLQADRVERRRSLALEEGSSAERASAVADKYANEIRDQRAESIARTETKEAVEEGRLVGWREAVNQDLLPRTVQRKWIAFGTASSSGGRLCEICEQLDGQVVGLDEPFYSEVLQEHLDRPPAHPQCRCDQVIDSGEET
jgi:hypothetical protein